MSAYVGWGIAVIVLLYVMFSTRNLFKDIVAIISKTLQETIKLAVTAVSFFLKIISVIEYYIVLIIDIFSGNLKQNSVTRLLSIALVMLSVASFYTTFTGMGFLIDGDASFLIRACLTFGVQAIMLGASLMIGKNSIVRAEEALLVPGFPQKSTHKLSVVLRVGSAVCAGLIYGLIYFLDLGRGTENFMYLVGCLLLLACLGSLLPYIFSETYRGVRSTILLIVYFGTLLVSSFFSYHTLLGTLYRDDERLADNIAIVAEEVSDLIEDASGCFDEAYQAEVQTRLLNAVDRLKEDLETGSFRGTDNLRQVAESTTFETNQGTIQRLVDEYDQAGTVSARKMEIEFYIRSTLGPIFNQEIQMVPGIQSFRDILAYETEKSDCIAGINTLLINLQKLEWDTGEAQDSAAALEGVSNFINKYISVTDRERIDPNLRELSGLFEAASVWKQFVFTAKELQQEILSLDTASGTLDWDTSMNAISQQVQELLKSVPPYFQSFSKDSAGQALQPDGKQVSAAQLSLRLQRVMRSHKPSMNRITQNLRAFVDAPQISLFAALIAGLIDTLILFVGMLLPKMIRYFKDTRAYELNGKYTPDEMEEILSNIFNKPVQERDE